jgi:hypothetical protein
LQAELSDHLGYDKGAPEAALFDNSHNGTTPKTLASQVGDVPLDVPRDRKGNFTWTLGAWRPSMECCFAKPWRGYGGCGRCMSGLGTSPQAVYLRKRESRRGDSNP